MKKDYSASQDITPEDMEEASAGVPGGTTITEETIHDDGAEMHHRSIDRTFEERGQLYRPYTCYVGRMLIPDEENEDEYYLQRYCEIFLNDEIVEPLHYTDLIQYMRKMSYIMDYIHIFISCPGGDIRTLQLLLNTIEEIRPNCTIVCSVQGHACSAAAVLALAGDYCEFGDFSYLMFHNISLSFGHETEHGKLTKSMKLMSSIYKKMLDRYATKVLTPKEIQSILEDDAEIYLDAEEVRRRYEAWESNGVKRG